MSERRRSTGTATSRGRPGPALRLPRVRPVRRRRGHRFNPAKLLIDPYAKAIEGPIRVRSRQRARRTRPTAPTTTDLVPDDEDDAAAIPKCVVVDDALRLGGRPPPRTPWHETVIYEVHVRGFTKLHPACARTCAAPTPASPRTRRSRISARLGVTAVELLPDPPHRRRAVPRRPGLTNYWGYSSIGFLAPHALYAATGRSGEQVLEFKGMVKALHRAGIEVILDVVYNHTAEGNHLGPMLSFRGVDNAALLPPDARRAALLHGLHGHGQLAQPRPPERAAADHGLVALLRRRVPRRRVPLRPRLGARARVLRRRPPLGLLRHDPPGPRALAGEADRRAVGRRPGRLPGRQLPACCGRSGTGCTATSCATSGGARRRVASSPSGSPARATSTPRTGARPFASINFVTAHDGFTLADLVSYDEKHNEANGEDNRDGTDDNRSWNCGVEGPTDDPEIVAPAAAPAPQLPRHAAALAGRADAARRRRARAHAARQQQRVVPGQRAVVVSDWDLEADAGRLLDVHTRVIALRHEHPVFRRQRFLEGRERWARERRTCGGSGPTGAR